MLYLSRTLWSRLWNKSLKSFSTPTESFSAMSSSPMSFHVDLEGSSYISSRSVQLSSRSILPSKIQSCTAPSVYQDSASVCVSTTDNKHYAVILNIPNMRKGSILSDVSSWMKDSVVCDNPLVDSCLCGDLLTISDAKGKVIFVSSSGHSVPTNVKAFSGAIRDMACNESSVAVCSDCHLTVINKTNGSLAHNFSTKGTLSSLSYKESVITSTVEHGEIIQFDLRSKSPICYSMGKGELYAHGQLSDHTFVIGFGDGQLGIIDTRKMDDIKNIPTVQDPFVEGIGKIKMNSNASKMVVSGYTDFTVWSLNGSEANIDFLGHSLPSQDARSNGGSTVTDACFFGNNGILNCWSSSLIGMYDFNTQ